MRRGSVFRWLATALAVATSVFFVLVARDAFEGGSAGAKRLTSIAMHVLPAVILLAIVAVAWRRAWFGGAAFVGLALVYAVMIDFRFDWVLAISGPLLLVGLLYFWSWRASRSPAG